MTDEIRRALNARLSALEGSPETRARIRARTVESEQKEERIVKHRISMALALVTALMLLGGTALAAGLGLNLFELLGRDDERLRNLADKAVLETQEPVTVEHDMIGEVEAVITNAYYDGQSLEIAYVMRSTDHTEPWMPTDEELAEMEPYDDAQWMEHLMRLAGIEPAVDGAPYGAKQYSVFASDHMTANGIDVPPREAGGGSLEDGSSYEIIQYAVPLPEGVAEQDKLELRIPLNQNILYYWFDGSQWYMRSEGQKGVSAMTATVYRDAEAQFTRFTGSGEYQGVPVTVAVDLSIARGKVTIVAEENLFELHEAEGVLMSNWNMDLVDDQGRYLYEEGNGEPEHPREMHFECHGTGFIPESMTMLLYEYDWTDDSRTEDEARQAGVTITLTAE